jgi:hypothetical protein
VPLSNCYSHHIIITCWKFLLVIQNCEHGLLGKTITVVLRTWKICLLFWLLDYCLLFWLLDSCVWDNY